MSEISAMHVTNESESINPATGEVIARIPLNSVDDLIGKINSARSAQKQWAALPAKNRVQHIKKIQQYLLDHSDELSEIISANNGKLKIDALATEIFPAAIAVNYFCNKAKYFLKDKKLKPATWLLFFKRSKIVHVPYGVVGIVSPWNYPFSIPFLEIIPGLLAGNAVILKVASETQTIGIALKKCIEAAALPEGVFSYVNMSGRLATDTMLENGINKLFFTGSVEVGKSLMKKASETLTPLSLELGGNDAMIVCEDADLEHAAMGACWAGFQNCGQSCGGVERLYVHENVYEQFLHLLKTKVELIRVNPDQDFNSEMGVMTTEKQVASVNKHIDDAIKKGAKLFAQSSFPEVNSCKNIMPAMVFTNVDHTMKMMREETFGPVIGVMKFKNNDEAIRLTNDSNLGLTASVWSKNRKKAEQIGRMLEAGVITINDHLMSHGLAETPWGGFKESSIGRCHGEIGFNEMTQPQVIVNDILPFVKRDLWWFPFDKNLYNGLRGAINLFYNKSILRRITALFSFLRIVPRIFKK